MLWWEGCDVVRCGFWMNWSTGTDESHGATLTLPTKWGLILVGFLALFVKMTGQHLWTTLCYGIHQSLASSRSRDNIYHQLQLVLRNTENESSFIWNLIKIGNAHRGAKFEAYRRSFLLIVFAAVHGLGFWAAGGLSSRFITSNDEVLTIPSTCGWMAEPPLGDLSDDATFDAVNALIVMTRYGYRRSAAYSRTCYSNTGNNTESTSCGTYIKPKLAFNVTVSAQCPFDEAICNGPAFTVDTGFLRSDEHLGLNTRAKDAIWARKVFTCAPLDGEKYTDGWFPIPEQLNFTGLLPGALLKGYKFGPYRNATILPEHTFFKTSDWLWSQAQPYDLMWLSASVNYLGDHQLAFSPIPELRSPEADLTVVALTNRVSYRQSVHDPWFNSQNCSHSPTMGRYCQTTNVLSFLGCQERYQFCTRDYKKCSPLTGLHGISLNPEEFPGLNPVQRAVFRVYWSSMRMAQLNYQLGFVGVENLVANEYLWDEGLHLGVSASLPDDHWHREVTNWMSTMLSMMQRTVLAFARPPEFDIGPGISSMDHIAPIENPELAELCHKIKARSKSHMSFSVLGLFLTISLGLFIIISNLLLPKTVGHLQKRNGKGLHKRLEWIESSSFQLQRMAAEGRGVGPWAGRDEDIPHLVESGQVFNLTAQSLNGPWGRADCYETMVKELKESDEDTESTETHVPRAIGDLDVNNWGSDVRARLLAV